MAEYLTSSEWNYIIRCVNEGMKMEDVPIELSELQKEKYRDLEKEKQESEAKYGIPCIFSMVENDW